jgi:hypothetical protein
MMSLSLMKSSKVVKAEMVVVLESVVSLMKMKTMNLKILLDCIEGRALLECLS